MPAEAQLQSPAGGEQPSGQIHQLLDHSSQPSAFGRMPHRSKGGDLARLPDKAEDIVGKGAQSHHQGVGGKLAVRQPFEIQVGLELAMELLRGGMLPIEFDHIFRSCRKVGPPALKGDLRSEEKLTFFIDGPLSHPDDSFEGIGCFVDLFTFLDDHGADPLPFSGSLDRSLGKHPVAPGDDIAFPGIPFDDVVGLLRVFQGDQGLEGIVARVRANPERLLGQILGAGNHPLDEVDKPLLAMLAARPEFPLQAPALHAEIGSHGSIAIVVLVGAADTFLLGVGVILGKDVHIQGDQTAPVAGDRGFEPLEHGSRTSIDHRDQLSSGLVQSLPQPLDRGHPADTQGLFEIVVLSHGGNGLIIALAQTQQAQIAAQDIDLGNVIAPLGRPADIPAKVTVPVDAGASQGQPGVAGVEFFAALLQEHSFHVFAC